MRFITIYSTFISGAFACSAARPVVRGAWLLAFSLSLWLVSSGDARAQELRFLEVQRNGVGGVDRLDGPSGIQASPDGLHVYVAGAQAFGDAVVVFSRNTTTGALTFVEVERDGVNGVDGLDSARDVAISPGGKFVYVRGSGDDAIAVFSRDASTGELTFVDAVFNGVGGVAGLDFAGCLTVSPDGKHVYATGAGDDAVAVFSRDAVTGELTFVEALFNGGGVQGLDFVFPVTVSPDGKHVYTGSRDDNAIAVFSRDASTGELTFVEAVFDGVGVVDGLDGALGVVVSPDGSFVYAAGADDDAVAVFSRDAVTGELTFVEVHVDGVSGVDGLDASNALTLSPGGGFLYAAGAADNAVAVFSRDAVTGELTFLEAVFDGVGGVDGLDDATEVATSPDGYNVYASGFGEDAVAVFQQVSFVVTNTNDTGPGSLRQAIADANAQPNNGQIDVIHFDIDAQTDAGCDSGTGVCTIAVQSALPIVTEAVVIDGETQDGSDCGDDIPSRTLKIMLDGTSAPSGKDGFLIISSGSTVRGLAIGLFAGSDGSGVHLTGASSTYNIVECIFSGTDVTGTLDRGNSRGLLVTHGASNNTIGGTAPGSGNLFSGNAYGIILSAADTEDNVVQGNFIGTNAAGTAALDNSIDGIVLGDLAGPEPGASNNLIGGTTPQARNVISGNRFGILIAGTGVSGNLIQGNFIGTDLTGAVAIGNRSDGVVLGTLSPDLNTVGGTAPGAGNVISGNVGHGVYVEDDAKGIVQGNLIGTDVAGTAPLGNGGSGVFLGSPATGIVLGGTVAGAGNTIAYNTDRGVSLWMGAGTNNAIRGNSIFENGGLGIDLGHDGFTANDPGDGDGSPNNLQNFPDLTNAYVSESGDLIITYFVDTDLANATYPLTAEFFEADANDQEGQTVLGSDTYTAADHDGCGTPPCEKTVNLGNAAALGVAPADRFVATATDDGGNTSEFSVNQKISNTRYVATGGSDANNDCTDNLNPCRTLGHAVNQADEGDVIQLAAGAYNEPGLVIVKKVFIQGEGVVE